MHQQKLRLAEISQFQLKRVEIVQETLKKRLAKAEAVLARNQASNKQTKIKHYVKVLALREELELKLETWRNHVRNSIIQLKELKYQHIFFLKGLQTSLSILGECRKSSKKTS